MNSLSSSTEQAYYKLQRKEKELRHKIDTERELSIKQTEIPGYLASKFETSINVQKKRLLSVEAEYNRKKQSYEQQIAFFQGLLATLEATYPQQREEVETKIRSAEEFYEKEKERYSQPKKSKIWIKSEKELVEVLRQKEMLVPNSILEGEQVPEVKPQAPPLTPAPVAPAPAPAPAPAEESEEESEEEEKVPEPVVKKPIKKSLASVMLDLEEKRALERVADEKKAFALRKEQQRREYEARRQADLERLERDRARDEYEKDLQRKRNWEEASANNGRLPVRTAREVYPDPESEDDDKDSVDEMDDETFQREIQKLKEQQKKTFFKPQLSRSEEAQIPPSIVGDTKQQKKPLKKVGFRN